MESNEAFTQTEQPSQNDPASSLQTAPTSPLQNAPTGQPLTGNPGWLGRGISGAVLKWIAVVSMLIDHTAAVLYEAHWTLNGGLTHSQYLSYEFLRGVGRIAFPIYVFLLVEGYLHTSNRWKYFARLLAFGIVSEIPFDLAFNRSMFYWDYQNVYFTLALGLLCVLIWDVITEDDFKTAPAGKKIAAIAAAVVLITAGLVLKTDYNMFGVMLIFFMYLLRGNELPRVAVCGLILFETGPSELAALPDFILFHFYNGKRGRQPKYFFYLFYPCHLLLLVWIRHMMYGI